jgi:hypothetical protein
MRERARERDRERSMTGGRDAETEKANARKGGRRKGERD